MTRAFVLEVQKWLCKWILNGMPHNEYNICTHVNCRSVFLYEGYPCKPSFPFFLVGTQNKHPRTQTIFLFSFLCFFMDDVEAKSPVVVFVHYSLRSFRPRRDFQGLRFETSELPQKIKCIRFESCFGQSAIFLKALVPPSFDWGEGVCQPPFCQQAA